MPRTVTVHAVTNNLIGDETYEAWLKHESDAWILVDAGDVDQLSGAQDFVFPGLIDGANYSLQLRMKRAGRYRIGYLSADPESWPAASRIDFVPGSLISVAAPTLDAVDDWTRTSAVQTKFVVHITPDDVDSDLELLDNGVVIHTFVAPLDPTITYDVLNPTAGINHAFKARHVAGTLGGPFSATITKFAGPAPVANFIRTTPDDNFATYGVSWTDDGRTYRLEDDYECSDTFSVVDASADTGSKSVHKGTLLIPDGPTTSALFQARMRAEVVTFGVTDVSVWTTIPIVMDIDADDTEFNSCP